MKRDELVRLIQQLPEDTEFFVRHGNKYGDLEYEIFRDANNKYQFYFTTFYQMLSDKIKVIDGNDFLKPFSKEGLIEICHHGRSISGTCFSCDEEALEFAKHKMPEYETQLSGKYNVTENIRSNLIKLHEQHQLDYSDELTQNWLDLYDVYSILGDDD